MSRSKWFVAIMLGAAAVLARAQQPESQMPLGGAEQTGALAVRAVQGTEGGQDPGGAIAHVHLFHRNQLFRTIDVELDESGFAMVPDLPIGMGIRTVVQIEHAGVTYQETGPPMDPTSPSASVEVVVYDVTDTEPAWTVESREMDVIPEQDAVHVTEFLRVRNPGAATWLGGDLASNDKKSSVRVMLPAGARDVHLDQGFHGWCCTTYENGELAVQMPLMPGSTMYRYSYFVPIEGGRASVEFSSPAPTERVAVFVPGSGTTPEGEGLTEGALQRGANGPVRMFERQSVDREERVGIVLTGLAAPAPATTTSPGSGAGSTTSTGLVWGIIIAAGVVVALSVFVLVRGVRASA